MHSLCSPWRILETFPRTRKRADNICCRIWEKFVKQINKLFQRVASVIPFKFDQLANRGIITWTSHGHDAVLGQQAVS